MSRTSPAETFPALDRLGIVRAAFLPRLPGIDVDADRETALGRLRGVHDDILDGMGFPPRAYAEQVHGAKTAVATIPSPRPIPGVDGLATSASCLSLGIYVADCAAIFLVDPVRRAIALVHSGRKGTEGNILAAAVETLAAEFACEARHLVGVVSPCIRPPHYDVDFAATIAAQARELGIGEFHDAGVCTAANPGRYYSYRREKGRTGRMLAALALRG